MDLLVCPSCRGKLALQASLTEGGEIIEGKLTCSECRKSYAIEGGIPRLVPSAEKVSSEARRTVDRFGAEWNQWDSLGPHYEWQFLEWIAPNTRETFRGKVVLEGGCGKGRHSVLSAQFGAKDVIAVDLGSAVEAAYRNTRGLQNVHVVQADLFHLPIADGSVDMAFSLGVIHHTPDPRGCFLELVRKVRPGGRVIAWVYGRENNGWIVHVVSPIRAALTSRLPHEWIYQLSRIPAAALYAVGRGVYQPLNRPPFAAVGRKLFYNAYINYLAKFPYDEIHSIVHDHLTPPIAFYISREEFQSWFDEADLEEVQIGWHNQNSWRGTGVLSRKAEAAQLQAVEAG